MKNILLIILGCLVVVIPPMITNFIWDEFNLNGIGYAIGFIFITIIGVIIGARIATDAANKAAFIKNKDKPITTGEASNQSDETWFTMSIKDHKDGGSIHLVSKIKEEV